jgi:hypothetical protein
MASGSGPLGNSNIMKKVQNSKFSLKRGSSVPKRKDRAVDAKSNSGLDETYKDMMMNTSLIDQVQINRLGTKGMSMLKGNT